MKFVEHKEEVSKSYNPPGGGGRRAEGGRKDFNSSPLGHPTLIKTPIILIENFE